MVCTPTRQTQIVRSITMTTAKTTAQQTEIPEIATKVSEQIVSTVKQGQQLTVEAVQAWAKAAAALPVPELPDFPAVPSVPGFGAITTYTFDLAAELLQAQRDFALQLASVLAPAKAA
jgi:hypothetical protein